jgi:DNA-binding NarL/FixJ family response regulator
MRAEPEPPRPGRAGPVRLLIVDDHELARAGLRSMLAEEPDLEVVGEAENGREALALCDRLAPDLILMDVRMPELDGLAATAAVKAQCPRTSVVVVTMYEDPDYLFRAVQAGAAGYVLKDATRREVLAVVRRVLQGEAVLDPALATRLLRRLATDLGPPPAAGPAGGPLTARERDVLRLLVEGQTNQEIAAALGLSRGTVKVHVGRIIAKLDASDRTQAAVRAVRLGLVDAPTG